MIYKKFQDLKLSALGLGAMRLPVNENQEIDLSRTEEMVSHAMSHGINYYDTAWGYHGGQSEIAMGKVLRNYPRESYYLATKFPGYDLANMLKVEEIFEKQLEKTGMEYFDFYLYHNVCELNIEEYLKPEYGIHKYLLEQKKKGRIRHLGFSAHGGIEVIRKFLEAFGEDMEFGQLQINYIDYRFQKVKEKIDLLNRYNIPVWVMEPLRGGKLAKTAPEFEKRMKGLRPEEGVPAWAFRFLQGIPEVAVTLSGMSDMEQLMENISTYEVEKPLNESEQKVLDDILEETLFKKTLPCTGCRYCTQYCPKELDISKILDLYNEHLYAGGGFLPQFGLQAIDADKQPDSCVGCGSCEAVCPQQIKISEAMKDFAEKVKK